jgi:hypothetical protein
MRSKALTHRDAEKAYHDLNRGDRKHCPFDTTIVDPIISKESQDETEKVLEDDHDSEALNGQIPCHGVSKSCLYDQSNIR